MLYSNSKLLQGCQHGKLRHALAGKVHFISVDLQVLPLLVSAFQLRPNLILYKHFKLHEHLVIEIHVM